MRLVFKYWDKDSPRPRLAHTLAIAYMGLLAAENRGQFERQQDPPRRLGRWFGLSPKDAVSQDCVVYVTCSGEIKANLGIPAKSKR